MTGACRTHTAQPGPLGIARPGDKAGGLGRRLIQSAQSTDLRTYEPLSSRVEMYYVVQSSPLAPTAPFHRTKCRRAAGVGPLGVKVELSVPSRAQAVPQI